MFGVMGVWEMRGLRGENSDRGFLLFFVFVLFSTFMQCVLSLSFLNTGRVNSNGNDFLIKANDHLQRNGSTE
jgi:hypothetical protein